MADEKDKTTQSGAPSETEKMLRDALAQAKESVDEIRAETETVAGAVPLTEPAISPDSDSEPLSGIDLLSDVDLHVTIELGRTEMLVEEVLKLGAGSVVELDKLAGDPVDVYVNHRLVARGEVLVLNDNFCIRISEIIGDLEEAAEAVAQADKVKRAEPAKA